MPDADIPPIVLTDEEIAAIQAQVFTLPPEYRTRWAHLGVDSSVINTLLNHIPVAVLMDSIATLTEYNEESVLAELAVDRVTYDKLVKRIFNLFASTPDESIKLEKLESGLVGPRRCLQLALMAEKGEISSTSAKEIFLDFFDEKYDKLWPREIAEQKNLLQVSDESAIAAVVDEVMNDPASAKAIADIKAGNSKAIGYLVGQTMKKSQGKANPGLAQKLIRERL
mgnify:FL=1